MDYFTLERHVSELKELLADKPFVMRTYAGVGRTINLQLRFKGQTKIMTISLDNPLQGLRITKESPEVFKNFSMAKTLNRLIINSRLENIDMVGRDRIVKLHFVARDSYFGHRKDYFLICEFTGRIADIFICDAELVILDRVSRTSNNKLGSEYSEPDKLNIVPPTLRKEMVYREIPIKASSLELFASNLVNVYVINNKIRSISGFDLQHLLVEPRGAFPTVNQAVNWADENIVSISKIEEQRNRVLGVFNKQIQDTKELLELQKNAKEKNLKDGSHYRELGELVIENIYKIKPWTEEVELDCARTGRKVSAILDPKKKASENAQRFFDLAKKADRGVMAVKKRVKELSNRLAWLEEQRWLAQNATNVDDLILDKETNKDKEYKSKKSGLDRNRDRNRVRNTKPDFETETAMFFIGRSAKQNDFLTFKVAKNQDYWFHVKDVPGSHVILKMKEGKPTKEDLHQGALLAAQNSFSKNSNNVLVEYTRIAHVKRQPNGAVGQVFYTHQKGIFVNPLVD